MVLLIIYLRGNMMGIFTSRMFSPPSLGCSGINPSSIHYKNSLQKLLSLVSVTCQIHECSIRVCVRLFCARRANSFLLCSCSFTVLCALSSEMSNSRAMSVNILLLSCLIRVSSSSILPLSKALHHIQTCFHDITRSYYKSIN